MATVEQLAQALAEVRQLLGEAQRLATDAQRAAVPTRLKLRGHFFPRRLTTKIMKPCHHSSQYAVGHRENRRKVNSHQQGVTMRQSHSWFQSTSLEIDSSKSVNPKRL